MKTTCLKITLGFIVALLSECVWGQSKPWVYTQSFNDGRIVFVTSDRKVYTTSCSHVEYSNGKSHSGTNVCVNTISSVNECTPPRGYPKTDTISFDGEKGTIVYRGTLSTEFMRLRGVRGASDSEFWQATNICSKVSWVSAK